MLRVLNRAAGILALVLLGVVGSVAADDETTFYTTITKTATSTSAQSATTLWTPASGKSIVLQGCVVSTYLPVKISLQTSSVDVIAPMYLETYGWKQVGGSGAPIATLAADAVLTYSTVSTGYANSYATVSVTCWGYEAQL